MIFGEYSDIVENDILTMQRFLDISRFLYSGGWQVCSYVIKFAMIVFFWGANLMGRVGESLCNGTSCQI